MGWVTYRARFAGALMFVAVALLGNAPAHAAPSSSTQDDLVTRQALLERDVADLRNSTQQSAQAAYQAQKDGTQALNIRMDGLDKRFGDFTFYASLLGFCLTILGIAVGVAGFWTAGRKATEAANQAAKNWLTEHAGDLQKQIDDLKQQGNDLQRQAADIGEQMAEHCANVEAVAKASAEKIGRHEQDFAVRCAEAAANVEAAMDVKPKADRASAPAVISQSDQETLKQADEALKAKAEKDYTTEDWRQRGFAAIANKEFERAAFYFQQAIDAPGASAVDRIKNVVSRGYSLSKLGRNTEALALYDSVLSQYGASPEPGLREYLAKALVNKGVALWSLNRIDDAIAVYDLVVARFGDAPEAASREQVAKALFNKGVALGNLNRRDEAIAAYDLVVARFGVAAEVPLREQAAKALFNKGGTLASMNRSDETIAAYDLVVVHYGGAPETALREQAAKALHNKGVVLGRLNRNDEAIAAFDLVVARYGEAPETALREQVAKALINIGGRLMSLKRSEEAIIVYADIIRRFGGDAHEPIQKIVAVAVARKREMENRLPDAG